MQMLGTPLTDDPMETDADRRAELGEDIDIDIDFAGDDLLDEEDESMSEGEIELNEQILATTPQATDLFNDDEMVDGGHQEEFLYDSTSLHDEDLQDVEDLVGAQADRGDGSVDTRRGEPSTGTLSTDAVHHEWLAANQDPSSQVPPQQNPSDPNLRYHLSEPNINLYPGEQQQYDSLQPGMPNGATQGFPQVSYDPSQNINKGNGHPEGGGNAVLEAVHGSIEQHELPSTSLNDDGSNQQESSDKQEKLKPRKPPNRQVTVSYEGAELSLFRLADGDQDFLLEDEQLLDASIVKLLAACKPVLGEDVQHHELVIGVDDLDLEISEFAAEAGVTTISHLNDLFSQLQHFDGIESPKALHFNLYSRPSISDRLSYLRNAVENGIGLSAVSGLSDGPEYGVSTPLHFGGNDEENEGAELLVTHDSDEQSLEESSEAANQEPLSVHSDSAVINTSKVKVPRSIPNIKVANEPAAVISKSERSTIKVIKSQSNHEDDVRGTSGDLAQRSIKKPSHENNQQEKVRNPASIGDEDDVINYEEQEVIGSKSSSGTSTLRGNADSTKSLSLSSAAQPTLTTEVVPTESRKIGVSEHEKAANDGFESVDQRNGFQATDDYGHSTNVEGDYGSDDHKYGHEGNENEYGTSLEGQTQDRVTQQQDINYGHTKLQPESFDAGQEASDNLISTNLDLQDFDDHAGAYVEANNTAEQDFEAAENLKGIIEDPTLGANQDHIDDFEQPLDSSNQAKFQPETFLDDGDEITFEDDDGDQIKSSNIGHDQFLSPKDLKKRSRGTDADDDAANDPQDAKRIRSN